MPFSFRRFEEEQGGEARFIVDKEHGGVVWHPGVILTEADNLAHSGIAQVEMGHLREGLADLQRAITAAPHNVSIVEKTVAALQGMGELDLALQFCEQGLDRNPGSRDLRFAKSTLFARMGRTSEAIALIDELLREDPSAPGIWTNKGSILCNYMGDPEGAVACFDKALEIDDRLSTAWANRGTALSKLGRLKEALGSLEKALEISPNEADVHVGIGSVLQDDLGRSEDALKHFDTAVKLDAGHSMAWHCRGVALQALGRLREACESYERAIRADKKNTYPLWNLGLLLANTGQYVQAMNLFDRVLAIEPDNEEAKQCRAECRRLGG